MEENKEVMAKVGEPLLPVIAEVDRMGPQDRSPLVDIRKLKKLRKELNFRQVDISEKAHITAGYYSEIENGNRQPALDTLLAIAKALGTHVNNLLVDPGYLDPPQPSTPSEEAGTAGERAKPKGPNATQAA
jgi:Predicted transcriptional regulators